LQNKVQDIILNEEAVLFRQPLFFGINEAVTIEFPVVWLRRTCKFIEAGRAQTAVISIFNFLKLIQRDINLITPALAGLTAVKLLPATRANRWFYFSHLLIVLRVKG